MPASSLRNTNTGFTLIEMMLVLAIIAILALIAIPNLLASKTSANEAATCGCLKTFLAGAYQYEKKYDCFPASANEMYSGGVISPDSAQAFMSHYDNGDTGSSPKSGYLYWVLQGDTTNATGWLQPVAAGTGEKMASWAATSHAAIPYINGDHQYYISEQGSIFRHDEPTKGSPGYGLFLLDAMPLTTESTWNPAR